MDFKLIVRIPSERRIFQFHGNRADVRRYFSTIENHTEHAVELIDADARTVLLQASRGVTVDMLDAVMTECDLPEPITESIE